MASISSRVCKRAWATVALLAAVCMPVLAHAQPSAEAELPLPRDAAPIDVTGYWVSVVSEDWRFRMSVAQKGDWDIVPLNAEGRRAAMNSNLTADPCRAYGAAGIMRIPGRLRIVWEDDVTLRIETDAGRQTRRFQFTGFERERQEASSRQGYSVAEWLTSTPPPDFGARDSSGGELHVVTTNMLPGYYFKHGVAYSANAVLNEYFAHLTEANGDEYLLVTSIVEDRRYLREEFVRTLVFRQEVDDGGWNPTPCEVP
jgi:hypothetical protein